MYGNCCCAGKRVVGKGQRVIPVFYQQIVVQHDGKSGFKRGTVIDYRFYGNLRRIQWTLNGNRIFPAIRFCIYCNRDSTPCMSLQGHTGDRNHRLVRAFQRRRVMRCRGFGKNIHPRLKTLPHNHFRFVFAETNGIDFRLYRNMIGSRHITLGGTGGNNCLTEVNSSHNSIFRDGSHLFLIAVPMVPKVIRIFRKFYGFLEKGVAWR